MRISSPWCSGKIHNAQSVMLQSLPYQKHRLTNLIIQDTHKKLHHRGVAITVTALRQMYWVPSIRQWVRNALKGCVTRPKQWGKPYRAPDLLPLPKAHLGETTPFAVTGVNFTRTQDSDGDAKHISAFSPVQAPGQSISGRLLQIYLQKHFQ